jgi:hypothetical protein
LPSEIGTTTTAERRGRCVKYMEYHHSTINSEKKQFVPNEINKKIIIAYKSEKSS